METVNFNNQTLLSDDPTISTKDNSLSFTGVIAVDPLNLLNGLALTQNLLLQPISWTFAHPVSQVSFNADVLNVLGSATVNYYDENGNLLHSTNTSGLGEQTFTYSNPEIAQVQITGSDLSALTIDSISYQDTKPMITPVSIHSGDPLIGEYKWGSTHLTYSMPSSSGEYTSGGYQGVSGFQQLNGASASEVQQFMANISGETGLTLTQTTSPEANVRIGEATSIDTGDGSGAQAVTGSTVFGPGSSSSNAVGDVWLQAGSSVTQLELMKDVGEALGLQAGSLGGKHDSIAYSIMSNDTYPGGSPSDLSTVDAPSTLMQDDLVAMQKLYGANFALNSGNSVYRWNPNTGEESINGVGQGAPGDGKAFMTLWDGGGKDTFDFSAYTDHVHIDLRPGRWTSADQLQLANLGDDHSAPGNIAMAKLYQGDPQSLIENAIGGSGSDSIRGNADDNMLSGRGGNDRLYGGHGADNLFGGAGNDLLYGGHNSDNLSGGAGRDMLYGNGGSDSLTGGGGNDRLFGDHGSDILNGGRGADYLSGGQGADTFVYDHASDSTGHHFDTIANFGKVDKMQLWFQVTGIDHATHGALSSGNFNHDLAVATADLQAHHAEIFHAKSGTYAGDTFLIVDANGQAGYQAGSDLVIQLDHHHHHVTTSDFVTT